MFSAYSIKTFDAAGGNVMLMNSEATERVGAQITTGVLPAPASCRTAQRAQALNGAYYDWAISTVTAQAQTLD
ncbi:hypothetical protein J6590_011517 [Homalodisca vitripennis]|nr:hypothetical protein J6590_011517 [Homalodisca vitripennis]